MRLLTENEIKFLKETNITPTVIQVDEWRRTIFANELMLYKESEIFAHACRYAEKEYNINLPQFYDELVQDYDGISLEAEAPYIIYCLLTEEELDRMSNKQLLEWLQDWKYFFGYRKYDEWDAQVARYDAKRLFEGSGEVRVFDDGTIYISSSED